MDERKGKLQVRSIAAYEGDGNFLRVAYPAKRAGLDRADMPTAHKAGYLESLEADGVSVQQEGVKASTLLPTQTEIDGAMISFDRRGAS